MKMIAYSSLCCRYIDDILERALKNPYRAIEWDLNFIPPILSGLRLSSIIDIISNCHIKIRYHLPYSFIEISHEDKKIKNFSVLTIKNYLNFISKLNGEYAILHVGYNDGSNTEVAYSAIAEVAKYAKGLGINICIENLIKGLTTDVNFLMNALEIDNVYFCLDTGHADVVSRTDKYYMEKIFCIMNFCKHAHIYKTEDNYQNHIPFSDVLEIEKSIILENLFSSDCNWYTMELDSIENQIKQSGMILNKI